MAVFATQDLLSQGSIPALYWPRCFQVRCFWHPGEDVGGESCFPLAHMLSFLDWKITHMNGFRLKVLPASFEGTPRYFEPKNIRVPVSISPNKTKPLKHGWYHCNCWTFLSAIEHLLKPHSIHGIRQMQSHWTLWLLSWDDGTPRFPL